MHTYRGEIIRGEAVRIGEHDSLGRRNHGDKVSFFWRCHIKGWVAGPYAPKILAWGAYGPAAHPWEMR